MQFDPDEAVLNNVGGTKTLAETALAFDVERFVNISTDKAVKPVSMVGATKRIAEYVVRAISHRASPGQAFMSVRFGNVLGSRGSVVPIWQRQIRDGGPVTLTDAEMTRYLMTIPEACQLVLQAAAMADNGALYVLDMGTPVRMIDLARDLIQLMGYRPDVDIPIKTSGVRPGEKIHESLFAPDERSGPRSHEKIMSARHVLELDDGFMARIDELTRHAHARDLAKMFTTLDDLVPDFAPEAGLSVVDRQQLGERVT
jgi:FlaA1/EpsC-like NDP-sugar epimerase